MLVLLDNYDSFTWNLYELLRRRVKDVEVHRNDELTPETYKQLQPDALVISPGPGRPSEAGYSPAILDASMGKIPVFGVCLGCQMMAERAGARLRKAEPVHGKVSKITVRQQHPLFEGLPRSFSVMRYHSLVIDERTVGKRFRTLATTENGEIMAIAFGDSPDWGVQFHPESILTTRGQNMIDNWLLKAGYAISDLH